MGDQVKNFPNQASDLARIRQTLAVLRSLGAAGADVTDDGVLGYELARVGAYTFRGLDLSKGRPTQLLAARISQEKLKHASDQGARTNAREMRRTFLALGWLRVDGTLTVEGEQLLNSAAGSQEERILLADALWNLELSDSGGNVSHPVRVMLDLLNTAPSHHREGLELALEALDDSPGERKRARALYLLDETQRGKALGVSRTVINNARKIFPALAKTAGLAVDDGHGNLTLSPDGHALMGDPAATPGSVSRAGMAASQRRTRRKVTSSTVARGMDAKPRRNLTNEEQQRAAELLAERTNRHQAVVRALAGLIESSGTLYEDRFAFDLLWVSDNPSLPLILFEVKTVNGDAAEQCRRAVAQLSWYHFFEVSPDWPERAVREVAVFDAPLGGKQLQKYLESEDIASVHLQGSSFRPLSELGKDLPHLLGLEPAPAGG